MSIRQKLAKTEISKIGITENFPKTTIFPYFIVEMEKVMFITIERGLKK